MDYFMIVSKYATLDYITNSFLSINNKQTNNIFVTNTNIINVNKITIKVKSTDVIIAYKFLKKKDLFIKFDLSMDVFELLLKPENEALFFDIFKENIIKHVYLHNPYFEYCLCALETAPIEKIKCTLSFFTVNEEITDDHVCYFFSLLCQRGDLFIVKFFYEEWNISIKILNNCAEYAINNGDLEIIKFLIENGANMALQKEVLIKIAMENNFVDIFDYIFYPSIDKIYIKNDIFIRCMEANNLEIIQSVLSKSSFSEDWVNHKFNCCYNSSSEIASLLINSGANVEKYGKDLLKKAIKVKNKDLVAYLKKIV